MEYGRSATQYQSNDHPQQGIRGIQGLGVSPQHQYSVLLWQSKAAKISL